MAARAENGVRVCKEHVRCMLKDSNTPLRFWPWALLQFVRVFNHWPSKNGPPPWSYMHKSNFKFNLDTDIQRFGCYMTAHLPREHPLVIDTTNSDCALEGSFLCWDPATPLVWMWSFKYQRPMRMSDPIFSNHLLPFRDPQVIINHGDLTDQQVVAMHQQDLADATKAAEGDAEQLAADFLSQQSTQPHVSDTQTGEQPQPGRQLRSAKRTGEKETGEQQTGEQ